MPDSKINYSNYINTSEAIKLASDVGVSVTGETIRDWCERKHIGIKVAGRWKINPDKLNEVLKGE